MEYIYAAMLLHKAGKEINEDAVKAVLGAAGVQVDDARVKALVASLQGVNIDETIVKASVAAPAPVAAPVAKEEGKKEEKVDEKKKAAEEKKSEEQAAAGLGALFG